MGSGLEICGFGLEKSKTRLEIAGIGLETSQLRLEISIARLETSEWTTTSQNSKETVVI